MRIRLSSLLLGACGAWLVLLGFYFLFLRPALLTEDLRYIEATEPAVSLAMPGLAAWLKLVFIVLGGFATSSGVALGYLSIWILPRRLKGVGLTVAAITVLGPILMCAVNFALNSDFRWLLSAPAFLGTLGVVAYLRDR